jgi:hypothetical protein
VPSVFAIRVLRNDFPQISRELEPAILAATEKAGFDIERIGKSLARVRTGAMKSSIYTVTPHSSGVGGADSGAMAANPNVELFPPAALTQPQQVIVAVGVKYGAVVEYTVAPFMTPAAEVVRPDFERAIRDVLENPGRSGRGGGGFIGRTL